MPRQAKEKTKVEASKGGSLVPLERVERSILILRGEKVILDSDLADLYGVTTKRLNEQVRRNRGRFPPDFMFQLSKEEFAHLRSHFATSSPDWGGRRHPPLVFTEHGALMAANVLSSARAIAASVTVVRAFVRLRQLLATHIELKRQLDELEKKYDSQFQQVFVAIRALMSPLDPPNKGRIGFQPAAPEQVPGEPEPVRRESGKSLRARRRAST